MTKIFLNISVLLVLVSCKKNESAREPEYIDPQEENISVNSDIGKYTNTIHGFFLASVYGINSSTISFNSTLAVLSPTPKKLSYYYRPDSQLGTVLMADT